MAAFQAGQTLVGARRNGSNKPAESYRSEYVSGNYFSTFGITPYAGRNLLPSDDVKGATPVAMLSFRAWQEKFRKDPAVIGAGFVINGQPFTVIGITPPGFFGDRVQSDPPAFFLPLHAEPLISPAEHGAGGIVAPLARSHRPHSTRRGYRRDGSADASAVTTIPA